MVGSGLVDWLVRDSPRFNPMTAKRVTQRRTKLEKHFDTVFTDIMSGMPNTAIAQKYDVDKSAVTYFKQRNAEALDQAMKEVVRYSRAQDIANKDFRISELGSLYTVAKSEIDVAETTPDRLNAVKTAMGALRGVAEELGQLPRPDQNINVKAMLLVREIGGTDVDVS